MIEELISRVFYARNVAHFEHWIASGVGSYARHKALGKFYEGLPELADSFAEAWQAVHGLMGPVTLQSAEKNRDILEFLQDQVERIQAGRYEFCDREETAIQNIIDEIVAHYLSAIYKLRFLS